MTAHVDNRAFEESIDQLVRPTQKALLLSAF